MLGAITIALTLASTFMAADTVSHVSDLVAVNVGSVLLALWITALVLAFLDSNWFGLLGFAHTVIFLACALAAYQRDPDHFTTKDYIRVPLFVYVPAFLFLYMISE